MPTKQIKNEEQYEKLRQKGMSKEKAARIANSSQKDTNAGKSSQKYEEWTKGELYGKAREVGIEGRSKMNKQDLIQALRNH